MEMKISNVIPRNDVFLAPMAGVTDMPFRILCREHGAGLVYTEMISAKGMHYSNGKTLKIAEINPEEKPCAIQIFGSEPHIMSEIAEQLSDSDASIIDINMGCPTPKITKNGEGSALMKDPLLAGRIIESVVRAASKPVTVKIRKGWDDDSINAVEIGRIAEQSGASAVTLHGRTRQQFYSGKADWGIIRELKQTLSIPVIGNGDIFEPEDAKKMFNETGCDAVMVGRGARGNPWIFRRTVHYLKTGELIPEPSFEEKINTIIRHMEMLIDITDEHSGVLEMRKHVAWYLKSLRNSTNIKDMIFRLTNKEDIIALLNDYAEELSGFDAAVAIHS